MQDDQHPIPIKNVAEHRPHQVRSNSHGVVTMRVRIVALLALMINDQTVRIVLPVLHTNELVHVYRLTIGRGPQKHADHVSDVSQLPD